MPGLLVINPRAGTARPTTDDLAAAARSRGLTVHVLEPGADAAEVARAANADAIGMAGGDGSLGAVAEVAIERDLPFVAVPFGTRNHFARDLGLDRNDPIGALDAFGGSERRVDVGRANGRLFLNNVSLGFYARLVHRRERRRRRRVAAARLRALLVTLRHRHPLALTVDGKPVAARIVLVASNAYRLDALSLGERERLDDGLLHLYVAERWLPRTWDERTAERFTIDAAGGSIAAAIDGEPAVLETPLETRIEPRALRVLVPPR